MADSCEHGKLQSGTLKMREHSSRTEQLIVSDERISFEQLVTSAYS
jgi:hypothetical protein